MSKLKTTGKPRQFATGAQRDNAEGKPRMSLVPHKALYAVMERYLVGAELAMLSCLLDFTYIKPV